MRIVCFLAGFYDVILGVCMLFLLRPMLAIIKVEEPRYLLNGNLNGAFLLCVGAGYYFPYKDPVKYLFYIWLMGIFLRGLGFFVILFDGLFRSTPLVFQLFGIMDGLFALAFLLICLREPSFQPWRR